jgi:hypothetical protein
MQNWLSRSLPLLIASIAFVVGAIVAPTPAPAFNFADIAAVDQGSIASELNVQYLFYKCHSHSCDANYQAICLHDLNYIDDLTRPAYPKNYKVAIRYCKMLVKQMLAKQVPKK